MLDGSMNYPSVDHGIMALDVFRSRMEGDLRWKRRGSKPRPSIGGSIGWACTDGCQQVLASGTPNAASNQAFLALDRYASRIWLPPGGPTQSGLDRRRRPGRGHSRADNL